MSWREQEKYCEIKECGRAIAEETDGEEEKEREPEEVLPCDVSDCKEWRGQQHCSGQRGWGISQEGAGVVRVLVMADGEQFNAKGIFAVGTDVQVVPQ